MLNRKSNHIPKLFKDRTIKGKGRTPKTEDKEMNGMKAILPIWHKVSKDEVQKFSLSLADKIAFNSSIYSVKEIAEEINESIK